MTTEYQEIKQLLDRYAHKTEIGWQLAETDELTALYDTGRSIVFLAGSEGELTVTGAELTTIHPPTRPPYSFLRLTFSLDLPLCKTEII